MASISLSNHLLCVYSSKRINQSPNKSQSHRRHLTCSVRLRTAAKSSPRKDATTSVESSPESQTSKRLNRPEPNRSNLPDYLSLSISRLRDGLNIDDLGMDILSIALPAALALAADPITSLIDTAFVGHLGSVELAAVGVSVSVFNLVSKLFNVPLLNITTSFVAEEQTLQGQGSDQIANDEDVKQQGKKQLPSVSASLSLAAGLGVAEAIALSVGSGSLMNIMGIPADSPMRAPAESFLTLRAFGAPPIVIALAIQGAFRGLKDTKTPLYAIGAGNILNAILDPIFIFSLNFGIGGAAIATVISEYLIAFILLWELSDKVLLTSPDIDTKRVVSYTVSGGLLIARTVAVLLTMTSATSMAAREGSVPMAGHEICIQVWLAISLLTDALALAGQALLATGYSKGDYEEAREVIYRTLQIGSGIGISLAILLFLGFDALSHLFSTDSEVLEIARSGILFVAGSQPMNALAFVLDGLYYGVSDFGYAAYSMVIVGVISSVFIIVAAPIFGLPGIWTGLFLFMTLRVVAGLLRLGTRTGPWKMVWSDTEK